MDTNSLDYFLYYDEDHDIEPEQMTEWTPVDPIHLVELIERGLLKYGEVFSHKGWHHVIDNFQGEIEGRMWDGDMELGESFWHGDQTDNEWW
jgi:hypothetical protein